MATKAGQHYETFSAVAYAADVFIPLVPLGQEAAWAPTTQTTLGKIVWVLNWFVNCLAGSSPHWVPLPSPGLFGGIE